MSDPQIPEMVLRPYMVSLAFLSGPLFINAIMAPSPESATAMFSVMIMREYAVPQPLTGCAATELTVEFLRAALRAAEGKLPPGGEAQVLSLVVPQVPQMTVDDPHAPPQDDPEPPPAA
jgi:hypothetical protein